MSDSIKGLIQGMTKQTNSILLGVVVDERPLRIKVVNDEKLLLNQNTLIVPKHLTEYTTNVSMSVYNGSLESVTKNDEGHQHSDSGHSHIGGSHSHLLDTFNLTKGSITVHNSLKINETVFLLPINERKKYYILDRTND